MALRGTNPTGEQFIVSEILGLPLLPPAASTTTELDTIQTRLGTDNHPLNILISSGPFTSDTNLAFEPLQALCDKAAETHADALILTGPFLDTEHPLLLSGDIPDLPFSGLNISPDTATLTDVFRALIAQPLHHLAQRVPSITIILVPSVRDVINKHVSWPQDRMSRKELGLPKQAVVVSNPVTISLNEIVVGISSQDVLYELQQEKCTGPNQSAENRDLLARLSRHIIEQRHYFPLFPPTARENLPRPSATDFSGNRNQDESDNTQEAQHKATGAMLDLSYTALGEWQHVRPDIVILPSALAPFAKVVESVVVVNSGMLAKKRGPGTFVQMTVKGMERTEGGEDVIGHGLFERARVDVVRI